MSLIEIAEPERVYLGHAIVDGKIRFLSVSQVTTYDPSQDGGCPRRWAFKYKFGKKEPVTAALAEGKEYAKSLEHYLKSGEDVLLPVLRAGKHLFPKPGVDLEVEKPLGDAVRAIKLRETYLKSSVPEEAVLIAQEMKKLAGLSAANIPFTGAADFRHQRGEYIDVDGVLRPEQSGIRVVEVGDLKSTAQIDSHTSKNGKVKPGYAKTVEQVLAHPQMVGYAVHAADAYPEATHIRLSHIYCQKRSFAAAKRTGLITVEEARHRWERIENLVREMEIAAVASRPEDVPVNTKSCRAFNKDCPHIEYCTRPARSVIELADFPHLPRSNNQGDNMGMGLFDRLTSTTNGVSAVPMAPLAPPAPPSPPSEIERQAAIDAEKARLLADDKQTSYGFCSVCGTSVNSANASRLSDGTVRHIGCPTRAIAPLPPTAPPPPHIGAINPPDAPAPDPIAAAAPLPPEVIATIEDAELKTRAETHSAAHAAREAAKPQAIEKAKTGGRCQSSGKTYALADKEKASRKKNCPECGKEMKVKDKDFTPDYASFVMPAHNMPKAEPVAPTAPTTGPNTTMVNQMFGAPTAPPVVIAPPPPAPMAQAISVPSAPPPAPSIPSVPMSQARGTAGIVLYVDVIFEKGDAPKSLDTWYIDLVQTIEKKYQLDDIRLAPNTGDLGYGKWKGYLAATCRANVPPPGEYVLRGTATSEILQVVLEALTPFCERVVRGGR